MPLVSIVIPTKNAGPGFRRTLEAIFAQQAPFDIEVIIVDSGSDDGTVELCHEFPVRLLHVQPEAFNHGATRNFAISHARGEFVALTVQDAEPADRDWLVTLVNPLQADATVAGAYGRQVPRPGASWLSRERNRLWYAGLEAESASPWFDNVNGCLRRAAWEPHPFPELPYAEDLAWARAVARDGGALVYVPEARVWHSHERSLAYELRRAYLEGRVAAEALGMQPLALDDEQAHGFSSFLFQELHALADELSLDGPVAGAIAWQGLESATGGFAEPMPKEEIAEALDNLGWLPGPVAAEVVQRVFGPDTPWPEAERNRWLTELDWRDLVAEQERLGEEAWHRALFDADCVRHIFSPDSPWPAKDREWLLDELDRFARLRWLQGQIWYRVLPKPRRLERALLRLRARLNRRPLTRRISDAVAGVAGLSEADVALVFDGLWHGLGQAHYVRGAVSDVALPKRSKLSDRIRAYLAGQASLSDEEAVDICRRIWVHLGHRYVTSSLADPVLNARARSMALVLDLTQPTRREEQLSRGFFWRAWLFAVATTVGQLLGQGASTALGGLPQPATEPESDEDLWRQLEALTEGSVDEPFPWSRLDDLLAAGV
jgi:rhamnosyltransferase